MNFIRNLVTCSGDNEPCFEMENKANKTLLIKDRKSKIASWCFETSIDETKRSESQQSIKPRYKSTVIPEVNENDPEYYKIYNFNEIAIYMETSHKKISLLNQRFSQR